MKISTLLPISLLILISLFNLTLSKQCNPHDEKVLLNIKKQLGNPSSLASWNPRTDCCKDWDQNAITCNEKGQVASLDFSTFEKFTGPFPPAIGDLNSLTFLSFIKFSGRFPVAICKLTTLKTLVVRSTRLTGTIPECLSQLKNLDMLLIESNPGITGSIPKTLAQLTKLIWFSVANNKLSGPIPNVFGRMPELVSIDLKYNRFSGPIPSFLSQPKVTYISLSGNQFTGSIPESFGSFREHVAIELRENRLTGPLPRSMGRVNWKILDLSSNKLTGDASFLFGRNKKIAMIVNLSNNQFKFDFSKLDLPLESRIRDLNISHNMIYGSFPKQIAQLPLETFDVSYNKLCGRIPSIKNRQFGAVYFAHNRCLCGPPLRTCK